VLPKRREAAPKQASRPRRPAKRPTGAKRPASPRVRRRRSVVVTLLSALLLLAFLFAFVYPTRTYLKQREQMQASQERLDVLQRETVALDRDTKRLGGDAEVERIAREQYGLVRPGETPYVLVPETTPATPATPAIPTTPTTPTTTAPPGK
jgi:cell division protein FtsB